MPSNGLQLGIGYGEKGMILSPDDASEEDDRRIGFGFTYLEFPMLVRLGPPRARTVRPYFGVSGVMSLLSNCNYFSGRGRARISSVCSTYDIKNERIEFGVTASASVVIAMPRAWSIVVDASYVHGITSMLDGQELKSRALLIMTGITYSF